MTRVWPRVLEALDRHGRAAIVTIAAARGSSPREAGARMIVHPDGGFTGTIGGGTLEWRAFALAQTMLANPNGKQAQLRNFALGPELGQCCGGNVDLLIELVGASDRDQLADFARREEAGRLTTGGTVSAAGVARRVLEDESMPPGSATLTGTLLREGFGEDSRPLILFGAGHVGRALVLALAPLPFATTWVDPRPDAFPAFVPANVSLRGFPEPSDAFADAKPGTFVLVMTHSHPLDLALVHAALGDDRFRYVGLIGSKSKRARFEHRLAEAGVPRERIASLVCPIGIDGVHSKVPAVIAAATVAELLIRDEALRAAALPAEATPLRRAGKAR
jgi:xanthine dehydrogenase accessory factor